MKTRFHMNDTASIIKGWQRIVLLIIPYMLVVGMLQFIGGGISGVAMSDYNAMDTLTSFQHLIISLFDFIGTFFVLWIFMKYVDKEAFYELGFQTESRLKDVVIGMVVGLLIMLFGYGVLIYLKEIFFVKLNFDVKELVMSVLLFTFVAVVEETICRGYILRNLMLSFNKYVALVVSSLLFAVMHAFNPNMDLFSMLSIFSAGILLGISYIYTKNLWFPIALHLSWNLFQTLLGFNVSGLETYSLVEIRIPEHNIINGGAFGFEGSYLSLIAELITITSIGIYYNRKKTKQNNLV